MTITKTMTIITGVERVKLLMKGKKNNAPARNIKKYFPVTRPRRPTIPANIPTEPLPPNNAASEPATTILVSRSK